MKANWTHFILSVALVAFISCSKKESKNYLQYVDPMIGTSTADTKLVKENPGDHVNYGQTNPAVTAPFGMTQWVPQIQSSEKKCLSPFYFGTTKIQGFRATHWLNGSCVKDYGSFTVFPTDVTTNFQFLPEQRLTRYLFNSEIISPAYFSTNLPQHNIMAETTATKRCGFFRFSWLLPENPTIIIDVNSDEGQGYIKIDEENQEIIGYNPVHRIYNGQGKSAGFSGYFVAKFDRPFKKTGTYSGMDYEHGLNERKNQEKIGAYVSFDLKGTDGVVKLKVGTSFTSIENARNNLQTEIPDWSFENTKATLENDWNTMLGKIDVETDSQDELTKFYTAFYHALFHPRLYSDVNGDYPEFSKNYSIKNTGGFDYYCDFSNWDIYRAQMPLLSLVAPKEYNNMIRSLVLKAEQGGWLPIFPLWNSYTSAMIGDHSTSILADAAVKGFSFDLEKAYTYMRKNAFETPEKIEDYIDGKGRRSLTSYIELGYIPLEDEVEHAFHKREQVSRTMEYAYNDWAVAQVAKKLGKTDDYNELLARSYNYTNVFDESKGWVCGRFYDGTFTDEFNLNSHMPYITEGTPKHYSWYVPHDVSGLIETMGGKDRFHTELTAFIKNREYWHGNEPSHQIPFLFNYVNDWEMTQKTVKDILQAEYGVGPGGLSGNDDAGQISAWYVFGAMGFYPVCPGSNEYQLSSPVFKKVTLTLDKAFYPGGIFVLETDSEDNFNTFNTILLDGKETVPAISHKNLQKGGKLTFSNIE